MNQIPIPGCNTVPLDSYLKALGILRLLSEQAPEADTRGFWRNDSFVMETAWTKEQILDFFLNRYAPTPVIAPWNGGSGFYPKDQKSGIDGICVSTTTRFAACRETIAVAKSVLLKLGITEKSADRKAELLDACRAELPDKALNWLDCAYVLAEGGPKYPALLGTGGNDGRLDFTNNYLQRIVEVFGLPNGETPAESAAMLKSALFGSPVAGLGDSAIGQFNPLAGGGPNTGSGFEGAGNVNPWNFILMLEGAMCFAAAATKRLGSVQDGRLAFPFSVRPVAVGYGSAVDDEDASTRSEMWMPLWSRPASFAEIHSLFAEGKVQVNGRPVHDAVEFYRAIAALGVDRGVSAFQRYAFQMRNGLAFFAVALDRVPVVPHAEVNALLAPIDDWMRRFRGAALADNAPAGVARACRRLNNAVVALSTRGGVAVLGMLTALGECDAALSNSLKWAKEKNVKPMPPLHPQWLEFVRQGAENNGVELRLAAALASFTTFFGSGKDGAYVPTRAHLCPVNIFTRKGESAATAKWPGLDSRNIVWRSGRLVDSMLAVMERRLVLAGMRGEPVLPQYCGISADLDDIAQFIDGQVDEAAIEAMLRGLCLIDWRSPELDKSRRKFLEKRTGDNRANTMPPLIYSLMRLCYPAEKDVVPLVPMIFRRAASGDGGQAAELASRRLLGSGFAPVVRELAASGESVRRAAAALLFPISPNSFAALSKRALRHGDNDNNDSNPTEYELTPAS